MEEGHTKHHKLIGAKEGLAICMKFYEKSLLVMSNLQEPLRHNNWTYYLWDQLSKTAYKWKKVLADQMACRYFSVCPSVYTRLFSKYRTQISHTCFTYQKAAHVFFYVFDKIHLRNFTWAFVQINGAIS